MKLTRRLEAEIARLHREREIEGPIGLGLGQEAVSIGTAFPLDSHDVVSSSLPSVGHLLVRGIQPVEILAHVLGKQRSPTRGRDGSTYLGSLIRGVVSPAGHLATHVGVLAGVALASKTMGRQVVAVALADERAVGTGDFHEGINFAAVHRLPLVVVLDHVPAATSEGGSVHEMSRGYGVPSLPVDGVDVLQVLHVIETAVERARGGKGPTVVVVRTARRLGYELGDAAPPSPFVARRNELSAGVEAPAEGGGLQDPVASFETFLVDHQLLKPVERGLILDRVEQLVAATLKNALEEPLPDAGLAAGEVFTSAAEETV
jgi:pyruvate dehydrogenase E1 component alpha subunit/2-oxoisovalerate dehydrogenase E1 component alpha subunit